MSDFSYDSYDSSALKVAFENLRAAEQQGFWLGLVAGSPLGVWLVSRKTIQHKIGGGPTTKVLSALFVGSLMYPCPYPATVHAFSVPGRTTTNERQN
jgi:hypothetical protein